MSARPVNLVLAGLVALAGGVLVWTLTLDEPGEGTRPGVNRDNGTYTVGSVPDDDAHDAVVAAVETAEVALGWDYRRLDEGLADATSRMTDDLVSGPQGFRATFDKITRPRARTNKAVVDALVRGAGEVSTDDGRVTVLLFVDQVVVDRETAKNPTVPYEVVATRVVMELERVDGDWLVDEIGTISNT
jgi:hypothetical protein